MMRFDKNRRNGSEFVRVGGAFNRKVGSRRSTKVLCEGGKRQEWSGKG